MKKCDQSTVLDWHWRSGGHFTSNCMLPVSAFMQLAFSLSYTAIFVRFAFDVTYADVAYAAVKSNGCFI